MHCETNFSSLARLQPYGGEDYGMYYALAICFVTFTACLVILVLFMAWEHHREENRKSDQES